MQLELKTTHDDFEIKQELIERIHKDYNPMNDIEISTMTWIIDTRSKSLRQALIKMGWTPPEEET